MGALQLLDLAVESHGQGRSSSSRASTRLHYRAYPIGRADGQARFARDPEFQITTKGADHPFHIHVNPCWVTRIEVPDEHGRLHNILDAPQWMDTVSIPRGGRVVFRSRFADYVGKWVNHCHILMHEDHGMMQAVESVPRAKGANYNPRARVASHAMPADEVNAIYPPPSHGADVPAEPVVRRLETRSSVRSFPAFRWTCRRSRSERAQRRRYNLVNSPFKESVMRQLPLGRSGVRGVLIGRRSAQGPQPIADAVRSAWDGAKKNIRESAEFMPEANFSFKPVDTVRTFGQILGHVAGANYVFCAAAKGEKSPHAEDAFEKLATKAAIVKALDESIDVLRRGVRCADDRKLAETIDMPFGMGKGARSRALVMNIGHLNEHYGNLVTYIRIKGHRPADR